MTNQKRYNVIFFVKFPTPGSVKTRLASKLGEEHATALYRMFIVDMLDSLNKLSITPSIAFTPATAREGFAQWLGNKYDFTAQQGDDLGERMANAFAKAFNQGCDKALLIGSDLPDLPAEYIKEALNTLESNDSVIGPSDDGGYYLIGFNKNSFSKDAFSNISWSTAQVYEQTLNALKNANHKTHTLSCWFDIDTLNDIKQLIKRNVNSDFKHSNTMRYVTEILKEE